MVFILALQGISTAPFRVVDEINQGLDQHNEKKVLLGCCLYVIFIEVSQGGSVFVNINYFQFQMMRLVCEIANGENKGGPLSQYIILTPQLVIPTEILSWIYSFTSPSYSSIFLAYWGG